MANYEIEENPIYDKLIRKLENTDPAEAETIFNPLFTKVINNIHSVKNSVDNFENYDDSDIKEELTNVKNDMGKINGKKYSTVTVGLSTMGYTESDVDFLCTGTNDQEVINTALASMTNGGELKILEGKYSVSDSINVTNNDIQITMTSGTHIIGLLTEEYANIAASLIRNKIFNVTAINISFLGGNIGNASGNSNIAICCETDAIINCIFNVTINKTAVGVACNSGGIIRNIDLYGDIYGLGTSSVSVYGASTSTLGDITTNCNISGSSDVYGVYSDGLINNITINGDISGSSDVYGVYGHSSINNITINGSINGIGSGTTYGVYATGTVNDIMVYGNISNNGIIYGVLCSKKVNRIIIYGDIISNSVIYGVCITTGYNVIGKVNDIIIYGNISGSSVYGVMVNQTANKITIYGDISSEGSVQGVYIQNSAYVNTTIVKGNISGVSNVCGIRILGTAKKVKVQSTITSTSTSISSNYVNGIRITGTNEKNITMTDCNITVIGNTSYTSAIRLEGSNYNCIVANNILTDEPIVTATSSNISVRDNIITG